MSRKYTEQELIEAAKTSTSYHSVLIKLNLNAVGGGSYSSIKRAIEEYKIDTSHFVGKRRTITKEELENACKKSESIAGVIRKLNLPTTSGSIANRVKRLIDDYKIDTAHFTGQGWLKNKKLPYRYPLEDYLTGKRRASSVNLKQRLIDDGIFKPMCDTCKNETWNGKTIPLELDHINGDHENNSLSNLRLLCPNCHAQTATYCGKNKFRCKNKVVQKSIASTATTETIETVEADIVESTSSKLCLDCKKVISNHSVRCKSCAAKLQPTKITWPSKEELEKLVWEKSRLQLAKELGVSDVAISKRCKKLGIAQPPPGYWAIQYAKNGL